MNCILINLIWPIFLYLIYVLQGKTNFLDSFIDGIHSGNERYVLIFVLGVSAVSVLVTAANCIASSALTREGSHLAFIKYIPMSYMAQINIKALVSIIISGAGMLIYVIAASVYLHLGIMLMTFCCVISLLSVAFASYFGIFMDSINPKLIWDSELNALRGNYNIFFNMAMAILLEGVTCAGAYLAFKYTHIGSLIIMLSLFILLMTLTAVSYLLCKFKATANIDRLSV
jgi:ABC-2 type transport system permease protein